MIRYRYLCCILGLLSGSYLSSNIALAKKDKNKNKVTNNYYGTQPGFTGYPPNYQPGSANPSQGYPSQGYPSQGYPSQGYPSQGYPSQGYPSQGYPSQGYPSQGYPSQGYPSQGYPSQGYPSQGYPSQGYPSQGYPSQGYSTDVNYTKKNHSDYQVPMKEKYGKTNKGKLSESNRYELTEEVRLSQQGISQSRYENIVRDPQIARNDRERLAGLSAREVFILVDRSGSMSIKDKNPISNGSSGYSPWSRWDSAKVAAQSIIELALCLDTDNQVEVILWDLQSRGLRTVNQSVTDTYELDNMFSKNKPGGSTPLYEVLEDTYQKWLRNLLQKSEPFTVVILTDGEPNEIEPVKQFFKKVIRENNLESPGRETLAAFSFVRMGDDPGAKKFLQDLDDNLISQLGVRVDIVDTKSDNFLFGTEEYYGRSGVGPFAMFWDALYD